MKRELAQIIAAFGQDVESAELDLLIVLAAVEGVEVGNAVDAEDYAIENKLSLLKPHYEMRVGRFKTGRQIRWKNPSSHRLGI